MIYRLVRALWKASLFLFFRRIDVQGRERVPARGPVLVVSNHANAFVDPLLMLTRLRRPVSLTAKSTLRGNPLLAVLMRALNVIEFHRAQDRTEGADPAKNVDSMAEVRRRLGEGGLVVIFPEGVSHSDPALRPFKTGAARIVFDFLDGHPGRPLTVVPAGVHYEAKERFRSAAGVVFGEPFDAAAWMIAHPGASARVLTNEMERRIRALTANFESERDIQTFARAEEVLRVAGSPPAPLGWDVPRDFAGQVQVIHRLQDGRAWLARERADELAVLESRIDGLYAELHRLGVSPRELFLPMGAARAAFFVVRELEVMLVGAPLAAWGWLNHAPAYAVLRALVMKMSKDRDHFASNAVFLALPVVPLFYALQIGGAAVLLPPLWALLYALVLPLSGAVALLWRDRAGGAWQRARTFLRFLRRPADPRRLQSQARAIADDLRRLAGEMEGAAGSADPLQTPPDAARPSAPPPLA